MTNFIGRGERTAISILSFVFGLPVYPTPAFSEKNVGIFVQVPLPRMLSRDYQKNLNEIHAKSSVDIVIITKKEKLAVYVNGKDHTGVLKSKRDAVRYEMLEKSGWKIVKVSEYECKEVFKDKANYKSVWEVCSALMTAKVKTGV